VNDERKFIRWVDIERAAEPLFSIWTDHPELQWARAAWERLERKGLTRADDEIERAVVLVRLVALAGFFHGFAEVAWQEGDVDPSFWASELEIRRGRLLQWLGREFEPDHSLDDEELHEWAFDDVYGTAYDQVTKAVVEGFGGIDSAFVSLWLSRSPDWSGRSDVSAELFSEIVNTPTAERLAAYGWLADQAR
jgi:hypothetical protein